MSVSYGTPQDIPNFYQNEQRFLYDLPEVKCKSCDICGDEIIKEDGFETDEGFLCKECYKQYEDSEEGELA